MSRLNEVRKRISELERIDLARADIDVLRLQVRFLLKQYSTVVIDWPVGQLLYRGVRIETEQQKPTTRSRISYPPVEFVKEFQRANRPGRPMFYCSVTRQPIFFELDVQPGDFVALSTWQSNVKFLANNVGFHASAFEALGAIRPVPWFTNEIERSPALEVVEAFFARQFTARNTEGETNKYKISAAIAEELCNKPVQLNHPNGENIQFSGLHYPTVAMFANSDNFALFPTFVDRYLQLICVEWIRVEEKLPLAKYRVSHLDYADAISADGNILWTGKRRPK